MICIYCRKELSEDNFSKEHIFPESIGGNLIIKNVCSVCNSYLGRNIDKHLVDNFIIKMIRAGLEIKNKSNNLTTPLNGGYIVSNPKALITQYYDKKSNSLKFKAAQTVVEEKSEDGLKTLFISGDISDDLNKKINEIVRKKGLLEPFDEKITTYKKPKIRKEEEINRLLIIPPLLKIAYSLGNYWLGEKYLNDRTGLLLSKKLLNPIDLSNHNNARESLMGIGITFSFFTEVNFNNWRQHSCCHIALLKKVGKDIVCYLRIFNIIEAQITISIDSKTYLDFQDQFLLIDPTNNVKIEKLLTEELKNPLKKDSASVFGLNWEQVKESTWLLSIKKNDTEVFNVTAEF